RKWTTEQATKLVDGKLSNRDFYRGAGLYQSALCSQCHVINDFGADIGPQLTTAGNKFSVEDLMRATIEPSHEISDQYAMTEIKTKDGKLVIGRLIEETDAGVVVLPDQRQPDKRVTVSLDQIASKEISKVSTMPAGLVDSMSASELRDLTAFIMSGGNKESGMFAPTEEVSAAE
ncbi:MAG: heme-binding protein, partial [Phycisphaeraceae bacterium]